MPKPIPADAAFSPSYLAASNGFNPEFFASYKYDAPICTIISCLCRAMRLSRSTELPSSCANTACGETNNSEKTTKQ